MFPRRFYRRILGQLLELDLYTPRISVGVKGITVHAPTMLLLQRNHLDWRWIVGVRVMGFGLAVSAPK